MEKWATVNIDLNKLIDICSNHEKSKEELLNDFKSINEKNIHKIFSYRKFNDDFSDKVTCYSDGKRVIGTICPSYVEFLNKLFDILNVNPNLRYLIARDDDNLGDVLKARIEILNSISDEESLRNNFPIIYKDLQDGRKCINDIRKKRRELKKNNTISEEERIKEEENLKKQEEKFYKRAMSPGLYAKRKHDGFIYKQVVLYTRFVENRKKYKELINKTNYNKYFRENFDIDKVALYVVNGYLKAIDARSKRKTQLKYYDLVEKFLKSPDFDRGKMIIIDGETINYDAIQKKAKDAYNKINRVNIHVEWELLPTGKGYDIVKDSDNVKKRIPMSQEDKDKLTKVGREINDFYMHTNYSAKAIGLKTFAGYFAYIYPNGVVVLDKDFKEGYPTTAEGAIYIMKAKDFELLSGIGKTELMYHPLLLAHKYHRNEWKPKIEAYINQEGTEEEKEDTKLLIKRMEEHKKKNI